MREYTVLKYLSGLMEANAVMIGIVIAEATDSTSRNYRAIAARTIGSLRKKSWILRVRELNAWQITMSGRTALEELHASHNS